jgi:hypothetical protein
MPLRVELTLDFKRVAIELVTQPDPFGRSFRLVVTWPWKQPCTFPLRKGKAITQETQHVGTVESFNRVVDKLRIESLEIFAVVKERM